MNNLILQHTEIAHEEDVSTQGGIRKQVEPPGECCAPPVQGVLGIAAVGLDEGGRCLLAQAKLACGCADDGESRPPNDNKSRAGNSHRARRVQPQKLFNSQN